MLVHYTLRNINDCDINFVLGEMYWFFKVRCSIFFTNNVTNGIIGAHLRPAQLPIIALKPRPRHLPTSSVLL